MDPPTAQLEQNLFRIVDLQQSPAAAALDQIPWLSSNPQNDRNSNVI